MDRLSHAARATLICVLLGLATLAAYWPVWRNDFLGVDDCQYVTGNPHVLTGLKWDNAKWAFQSGYASNWHPLTWLSHMLDVQLFGLKPGWHHLVNLLFHIANTVLLFLLLRRITGAEWPSAVTAALFALHPLHVESVAWVAERKDVLSTFFFMLTLGAYCRYTESRKQKAEGAKQKAESRKQKAESGGQKAASGTQNQAAAVDSPLPAPHSGLPAPCSGLFYLAALVFFALGLMSKPMLVTLPFVLLLLDFWPLERLAAPTLLRSRVPSLDHLTTPLLRLVIEKLPFLALAAASCVVTYVVQHRGHSVSAGTEFPLESRVANAIVSYVKYLGMTIWPVDLAIFYPHPDLRYPISTQWPGWQVALAALLLAAISAAALRRLRREPWFAVGWFWFLGTLVPAIGIVQAGGQALADRYTYVPLIGIFICLAWAGATLLPDRPFSRAALAVAGALAIVACAAVTRHQLRYWRDELTVFEHTLEVTKNNPMANYVVGSKLAERGRYDEAAKHFRAALDAYPAYGDAYHSLASILASQGKTDEAIELYQAGVRAKPWLPLPHNGLGAMLWAAGRRQEAIDQYREALQLDPNFAAAHYNLGSALLAQDKPDEAAGHLDAAARLNPAFAGGLVPLGRTLALQGRLVEAEARFAEVARLCPTNSAAHLNLGEVQWKLGKRDEALRQYAESLRLEPDQPLGLCAMASALLEQGNFAEAATHFGQAARLEPESVPAQTGLGRTLALQGRFEEALARFREVIRLCPTNAEARLNLGNALLAAGQTNEAATAFADARRLQPDLAAKSLQAGKALAEKGQLDAALASFFAAAQLEPNDPGAHENLGLLLARQGKLDEAVSQFEQTVRLRPDAQAWYNLGLARDAQGRPTAAATNYHQALQLNPDWPDALNNLAWLLATRPEAELRNGAEAVRLAERACRVSGGQEARFWGTLDAAYAEAGRFPEAISTAEKTRNLALAAGEKDLAQAAEQRLARYRKQQPYRQ